MFARFPSVQSKSTFLPFSVNRLSGYRVQKGFLSPTLRLLEYCCSFSCFSSKKKSFTNSTKIDDCGVFYGLKLQLECSEIDSVVPET
jgi:hypothetical protein